MESELPENRDKLQRTQSGMPAGDEGTFPAARDSSDGIFRRLPQSASEAAPVDYGWRHPAPRVYLLATSTWPWSERWSARENMKPTLRRLQLPRAAQRGIGPRRKARTSEQTQCRSKASTRRQGS